LGRLGRRETGAGRKEEGEKGRNEKKEMGSRELGAWSREITIP
jgi:hypothetical protein